ncbi:MAG: internalin, partial [Acidobacteriota bacterium]|nr:internalin [Acidobacteriota bacterium]
MPTDLELIEQLKKEIGVNLEELNHVKIMPDRLKGFSMDGNRSVTALNLCDIKLGDLSTSISKFKNLRKLNLLNTQLSDVSFLKGLVYLFELSLTGNQITDISPLRELIKLKELYLSDNRITDISPLIGLTKLERLYLDRNKIHFLPEEFFDLQMELVWEDEPKIGIHLGLNPIENPPLEILKQGKAAVKKYFASIKPADSRGAGNVPTNIDIRTDLQALKSDFFNLKDALDEVKKDKKLKEELKKIEDSLDELSLEPEKDKLVKPLNKVGRLLEQMGDEKSRWAKALKGAQKVIGLAWKLGCAYNR